MAIDIDIDIVIVIVSAVGVDPLIETETIETIETIVKATGIEIIHMEEAGAGVEAERGIIIIPTFSKLAHIVAHLVALQITIHSHIIQE